jgi:hypothetical protein
MTGRTHAKTRPLFFALSLFVGMLLLGGCDRSAPGTADSAKPSEIQFNSKIAFGEGGNAAPYKVSGWSKTEEKFTWSEGTSARLQVRLPAADGPVVLKARLAALVKAPELPAQPVEVYVNDKKVADWMVSETAEFTASIPAEITKPGGAVTIEFKTPKATSPKDLGISADPRVLGICCVDVEFSKA